MATKLEARSGPVVDRSTFTIVWFPPQAFLAPNPVDAHEGSEGRISCSGTKTRTKGTFQHGRRARGTGCGEAFSRLVIERRRALRPRPLERSRYPVSCSP